MGGILKYTKEDVSKQEFAYYLFLFRHGFHGKGIKKIREIRVIPCLKEIIKCILTHLHIFYLKNTPIYIA